MMYNLTQSLTLCSEGLQQHRIHTVNPTGPVGVHGVILKGDYLLEVQILLELEIKTINSNEDQKVFKTFSPWETKIRVVMRFDKTGYLK